jgi:cytidylate kinase
MKYKIITIDGPSGSGKSTIAKRLAKILGYTFLDTGAMYRTIAYVLKNNKIDFKKYLKDSLVEFSIKNKKLSIKIFGKIIKNEIRTPEIGKLASVISKEKPVRDYLVCEQRKLGKNANIVCEGRDMGSVVFPSSDLKIYLTCDEKERIKRRIEQNKRLNIKSNLEDIENEIQFRDKEDQERKHSPLIIPKNAYIIDSTCLTIDQVIEEIKHILT